MYLEESFDHNLIIGDVNDSFILISKVPTKEPRQVFVVAIFLSPIPMDNYISGVYIGERTFFVEQGMSLEHAIKDALLNILWNSTTYINKTQKWDAVEALSIKSKTLDLLLELERFLDYLQKINQQTSPNVNPPTFESLTEGYNPDSPNP